ncbi:MAG: exodeoxyribonuclease VII large subunit [Verrucomicrobiales bacterium]|nr:exodeoxyribonuclease VII large subunit [Verrucomicrobiales bacterium]
MPRKASHQWDFGDLFKRPPTLTRRDDPGAATETSGTGEAVRREKEAEKARTPERRVYSVTEVTARIKAVLEREVGPVWVSGEVSNLRAQSSGHVYFTLKDSGSQLSCVLFRGVSGVDRGSLRDGQGVTLQGDLSVYEPRGQYQLIVRAVELQGQGALQAAFERLKQRLAGEGLFEASRKRPIPTYPERVGIITSASGAALRDVLHVIERRYAGLELWLIPSRVQGKGAEAELAEAIRAANAWSDRRAGAGLEVLLLTRGGGSLEDLWCFNEEVLARAIAGSRIPVVSAVGHEIDFTIADFVADLRAATPSAAAELLTAGYVAARERIRRDALRLRRHAEAWLDRRGEVLAGLEGRLSRAHPRRKLNERLQRLDDWTDRLQRAGREAVASGRQRLAVVRTRLASVQPQRQLEMRRIRWREAQGALQASARDWMRSNRDRLERLALRLELLSPERVLARGYSITTMAKTGALLRRADGVVPGDYLRTRLFSGELTSVVAPADPAAERRPGAGAKHDPKNRESASDRSAASGAADSVEESAGDP